ncbi:MAG: pseudouridine synthase [Arenicella sp.]|jgi:23S rRNA pseudouridine2604 synthase|nr:pseudouridine synthase [Arenicella sp.]HAU69288.1 pseudouridylate synthase [Gammaproteobacteria bacterium]
MSELIRLSKLMSQRGISSRREADRLIEQGLVLVDGKKIDTLGTKVSEDAEVRLAKRGQEQQQRLVSIMINKPVGVVSGQAEDGYTPAVRLFTADNQSEIDNSGIKFNGSQLDGMAPAGRLDIDSQGLLVLTQDGRVAKAIIGEHTKLDKEYLVRVNELATEEQLEQLRFGLELDGKALKRAKVSQMNDEQLKIVLNEGKKRQIRRMCEMVGFSVHGLKRVRVGRLKLGHLPEGEWRYVTLEELVG